MSAPLLTLRQRQKVAAEIRGLIGPDTSDADYNCIMFVAEQIGRQTDDEIRFERGDARGRG